MEQWNAIKDKLETNDNILTVSMTDLRDATGKEKLGKHVRDQITKELAGMGIGHVPQKLPNYQDEIVRLYKRGTPIGDLIEMVLKPGVSHDNQLKKQLDKDAIDNALVIEQIRELVSE